MDNKCRIFEIKTFSNKGYFLTPIELKDVAPFEAKRIYYVDLPEGVATGEHCHKIEEELFIQVKGTSTVIIDRGNGKEKVKLVPGTAIYVPAYVWHGFTEPKDGCLVLAVSSTNYNPDRTDYVENYEEYLKIRDKKL